MKIAACVLVGAAAFFVTLVTLIGGYYLVRTGATEEMRAAGLASLATIAGVIGALAAAFVATSPVRKQLAESAIQTELMTRTVLEEWIYRGINRRKSTLKRLNDLLRDTSSEYHMLRPGQLPHWGHSTAFKIDREAVLLSEESQASIDRDGVKMAIYDACNVLANLADCLWATSASATWDPEYGGSLEEARSKEIEATERLPSCISAAAEAYDKLEKAFDADTAILMRRITQIDRNLVRRAR